MKSKVTKHKFETTDVHSTSLSDGSTLAPDYTGRYIQRALDHKVRKLRTMLAADEDIATELDRLVCRLMKLALRTSRIQQHPPPTSWMQCKLFDLLSLTEKAIDRRRKRFIENFPLTTLNSENQVRSIDESLATKVENDESVNELVNKYKYLVQSYESKEASQKAKNNYSNYGGFDLGENLSDTSNEFIQEYEFVNDVEFPHSAVCVEPPQKSKVYELEYAEDKEKSKLQRVQAWVNEDVEVVSYPDHDIRLISSGDTDQSATNIRNKLKKISRKRKVTLSAHINKQDLKIRKKSQPETSIEKYPKINNQEKQKSSKSKLFEKTTGKKSSYCLLVKANLYKTSSNSLRSKKMRDYLSPMKPIPGAFKELCHPDSMVTKKVKENMEYLINIDRVNDCGVIEKNENVAATEESLLMNIVMDGMEETIALRRTIGTDAEDDPTEIEQETVMGSVLNVMRNDSFCNKPELATENVQSQTIFLNDINEPSTSKGVRHVSMDVQCGPDVTTPAFSTLSTTTSFTKIPKIYNNGIKIGDSESELPAKHSDCGTCTGDNYGQWKTISPRNKSVGIIIKDSETDTNINRNKTECFTMTNYDRNDSTVVNQTELIKPISSDMKIEDSSSDYFESVASPKSIMHFYRSELISETVLNSSTSQERLGPKYACMKYVRPKLSLGGMHVHSYKDKQESEDVMYQGEWQRCRPKALTKKRVVFNTASAKKLSDLTKKLRVNSKEKLQNTKPAIKGVKLEKKNLKPVQVRMHKYEPKLKDENKIKHPVPNNFIKYNRSIPKVSTKLAVSSLTTNKPKAVLVSKKPAVLLPNTTKKEPENVLKGKLKLPEAGILKRKVLKPVSKNILNKSIDSAKKPSNTTKEKNSIAGLTSLVRSKTKIEKELLKFRDSPRDNISYVVLRNEPENKGNKNSVSPKTNTRKNDSSQKRSLSPQSQNSSTCSSPNSIATVRVVSNRPKATNRKVSSSSNQDNIDSDTVTPVRNKKFTKKNRIVKKAEASDLDNKENVPESSNSIKKDDGKAKSTYISTHKSVYRAQVATENLPLQNTLNSLSRHKTSTPIKANVKLASPSSIGNDSKSPNISCTDKLVSSQNTLTSQKSSTLLSTPNSKLQFEGDRSRSQTRLANSPDENITMSIKEMIEERLDFIRNSFDDLSSIDSKTVILSCENLNNFSLDETASPDSFRTVINNEDLDATLALHNYIEDAVNRTFDSITDSTNAVDDARALTDTDILSLQTTAAARPSEYFLAESDIDNLHCSVSKVNSVRDIFERREQLMAQSDGGNLASQAFSGFSISAVAGDRPDPISLIDSETGSLAIDIARQATSEEVFVSGRSSGSYESCLYDDAMIPYWLFHINNQFEDEDEDEEEEPEILPAPVELPEPVFDMNGNVVAAGAGAGDGRGMHSDQSQDSSGRGTTSTTSSDPSSGAQSEAILIDPSAFTAQYELPAIAVTTEVPEATLHEAGENIGEAVVSERNGRRNPVVQLLATSDMDADVSSLDTDVQDSS